MTKEQQLLAIEALTHFTQGITLHLLRGGELRPTDVKLLEEVSNVYMDYVHKEIIRQHFSTKL